MRQFLESLERRDEFRVKRQLPCTLLANGRIGRGIVRSVSAGGLFVENRDELPGTDFVVTFQGREAPHFVLETFSAYRSGVSLGLSHLLSSGIGLRIQNPPSDYLLWVERWNAEAQ